jgi:hypothetical protein
MYDLVSEYLMRRRAIGVSCSPHRSILRLRRSQEKRAKLSRNWNGCAAFVMNITTTATERSRAVCYVRVGKRKKAKRGTSGRTASAISARRTGRGESGCSAYERLMQR